VVVEESAVLFSIQRRSALLWHDEFTFRCKTARDRWRVGATIAGRKVHQGSCCEIEDACGWLAALATTRRERGSTELWWTEAY
jgi:hypothetical protein